MTQSDQALAKLDATDQAKLMAALNGDPIDPANLDGLGEGTVDFGVALGLSPELPIMVSLKDHVNAEVEIVDIDWIDNQFKDQRPDSSPRSAVITWREAPEGRFYRAVSSNQRVVKQAQLLGRMLVRYASVQAKIAAFSTSVGEGYYFVGKEGPQAPA